MDYLALIRTCRPKHWLKNFLVFAVPFFAFSIEPGVWFRAFGSLIALCLISSAIYLLNDSIDKEEDRKHPQKRYRPIAAGLVSVPIALTTSILLAIISLMLATTISNFLVYVILAYGVIQVGYCLRLKQEPLLDLLCIASGFLLRGIAGGVASGLAPSPWFLLTIGFLALFLAVEKRKSELQRIHESGVMTRKALRLYSLPLLMRLESLVATSAFMSYSLWAAGPAVGGASTSSMLLTVPFVLAGIFRYQLLSDPEISVRRRTLALACNCEKPEEILLYDRGIKMILLGWFFTTLTIGLIS